MIQLYLRNYFSPLSCTLRHVHCVMHIAQGTLWSYSNLPVLCTLWGCPTNVLHPVDLTHRCPAQSGVNPPMQSNYLLLGVTYHSCNRFMNQHNLLTIYCSYRKTFPGTVQKSAHRNLYSPSWLHDVPYRVWWWAPLAKYA